MALPASWTQVKVYGTYLRLDGTANSGQIWFESNSAVNVQDDQGNTILVVPKRLTADLDANGYFEIMLPATTDQDVDPLGWTYTVKERIADGLEYSIDVPADLLSLNLVPMRPKLPSGDLPPATINYLTTEDLGNTVARQGDLNTTNTTLATASANATAAINTVNSLTTTVNQAADTANAASAIANSLGDQVSAANTAASQAGADASNALTVANNASTAATNALNTANGLSDTVTQASSDAAAAQTAAAAASTNASNALTAANGALSTANAQADAVTAAQNLAQTTSDALATYKTDLRASSDPARGTALIGHEGQPLKTYLDALAASIGSGGGGGTGGTYTGPVKSVLDYYQAADGANYGPAIKRAWADGKAAIFPAGSWPVTSPVDIAGVNNPIIIGAAPAATSAPGVTTITCNNGLIINSSHTRGNGLRIYNLTMTGNGTKSCLNDEWGGVIQDCRITNFVSCIKNPNAYLLRVVRCAFATTSGYAMDVCDFNGSVVESCHFQDSCAGHFSVLESTPTQGYNNGYPFTLRNNNHNTGSGNGVTKPLVRCRGTFKMTDCYFEDYSSTGVVDGITFVEVNIDKFDLTGFTIENNELNGQGKADTGILIVGRQASAGKLVVDGLIRNNRIRGFLTKDIKFDNSNGTTIQGVRVSGFTTNGVTDLNAPNAYRPIASSFSLPLISIAGSTNVTVDIASGETVDVGAGLSSGKYTCPRAGIYKFTCQMTIRSTGGNYPNVGASLWKDNGATNICTSNGNLSYQGSTTQATLLLHAVTQVSAGNVITVTAHNGDILSEVSFSAEYLGDGWT